MMNGSEKLLAILASRGGAEHEGQPVGGKGESGSKDRE